MADLEKARKYTEISAALAETAMGRSAIRGAEGVNTKTGALLTHVSIMVAVATTLLFGVGKDAQGNFDLVLLAELFAYVTICVLCLTSIWASSHASYHKQQLSHLDQLIMITAKRRDRYQRTLILTIVVTVIFLLDILYLFLFKQPMTIMNIHSAWDTLAGLLPAN